jgi:tRNA threonylcarbamoyladenosine biosynthesis protein TsaB
MLILAIDTALDACSVAVFDTATEAFPALETEVIGKGHAERLMAMIETAMGKARVRFADLGRVAVTVGPGSFTGIRVGLAAARGIGLAGHLPVVGISTLDAIARGVPGHDPVCVALDARRSEVYVATYDADRQLIGAPEIVTIEEAAARARSTDIALHGSGAVLLAQHAPDVSFVISGETDWPDIRDVARLGAAAPAPSEPPKPLYLRAPDAKPQTRGRVERIGAAL